MSLDVSSPQLDALTFDTWDFFAAVESFVSSSPRSVHVTTAVNYIDVCRAARDRIVIVQENCRHLNAVHNFRQPSDVVNLFLNIASVVDILHRDDLICVNISPRTVNLTSPTTFKLVDYGLLYLRCNGIAVEQFGDPRYFAPELLNEPDLLLCPSFVDWQTHYAVDVWSIALTMLWFLFAREPCSMVASDADNEPTGVSEDRNFFRMLLTMGSDESLLDKLKLSHELWIERLFGEATLADALQNLLRQCLLRSAPLRPTISEIIVILKKLLSTQSLCKEQDRTCPVSLQFLPEITCADSLRSLTEVHKAKSPLEELYLDEIYYLWKISGGSAVRESSSNAVRRRKSNVDFEKIADDESVGFKIEDPVILSLPLVTHSEFSTCHLPDSAVVTPGDTPGRTSGAVSTVTLDMERLRSALCDLPHAFYPIFSRLHESKTSINNDDADKFHHHRADNKKLVQAHSRNPSDFDVSMAASYALPVVIRERNVYYTYHRVVLFRHILESFPYSDDLLWHEAVIDIPPLYRGATWAALLGIRCNMKFMYDRIDKISPTSADRQIEVDVPRCHQYEPLLSSPDAHDKFKRILKAWVRSSYPHYVYWQGLDSLCAPFLFLNFNNEALAFECLRRFIDKYLAGFFIYDNTDVIHEYLAVFQHLVAFQDPQLAYHLHSIGFQAELFAIPWFLTCFAHILPLDKVFLLWDALLLADSTFPLFIGLALLSQMRTKLLQLGFNECILLFSDLPDVDVEKIRADAWQYFYSTPKSVVVRSLDLTLLPPTATSSVKISDKFRQRDISTGVPNHHRGHENKNNSNRVLRSRSASLVMASGLSSKLIAVETLRSEVCPRIIIDDLLLTPEYEEYVGASSLPYSAMKHLRIGKKRPPLVVIDVRSPEDYGRGSLACSLNIPADDLPVNNVQTTTAQSGKQSSSNGNRGDGVIVHARAAGYLRLLSQFEGKLIVVLDSTEKRAADFAIKLLSYNFPKVCILHDGIECCRVRGILGVVQSD